MSIRKRDWKDPDCFRAIAINDPHFAAKSPPAFKVSYLDYLTTNVEKVLTFANTRNVDAILWAGDIFHLKEPRNNPLWLIAKVIGIMSHHDKYLGIPSLGIGGNHDYKHGSLEGGLHGSPLQILVEAGAYNLLDEEEWVFESPTGYKVRCAGGSYHHGQAQHVRDKKKDGADHLIALGHFWLGVQTGEFFGEALYGLDFFKESEVDTFIVGHHHEDKGIIETGSQQFISQGSISITGAHPHDLKRKPAAALIEINAQGERTTQLIRPKGPAAEELLDLESHAKIKEERKEMDEFIDQLGSTIVTASDPQAILGELAENANIRQRAQEYIERAEEEAK